MFTLETQRNRTQAGFTLIEMIVSLGIFSVVMTIAVGSLLVLIFNNQKLQGEQSVMTNLAFALDGMTREIRTGTHYFCDDAVSATSHVAPPPNPGASRIFDDSRSEHESLATSTRNCSASTRAYRGISFIEGGDSITGANDRILYYYASSSAEKTLKRRVGDGPSQSILSSGLEVLDAQFVVSGAEDANEQPTVTIFIEAKETNDDKIYRLQTTVTQRTLDL
jgi:prepilin-type N-terminal cleavage/methylation domain-containing protein